MIDDTVLTASPAVSPTEAERRTLRMGLVTWQRDLMRAPALLATPEGLAEWERIGRLLDVLH